MSKVMSKVNVFAILVTDGENSFGVRYDGTVVVTGDITPDRAAELFLRAASGWRPVCSIPAEWKPVPVEPTKAMLDAGQIAVKLALGPGASFALPAIYSAMINAAPEHKA